MSATREATVALHGAGISNTVIAKTLSIARSTVWKAISVLMKEEIFLMVKKVEDHAKNVQEK